MGLSKFLRVAYGALSIILIESLVFGLSAMPGLFTFRFILDTFGGVFGGYFETALLGIAFVPAYLVFAIALMFFTAIATTALRWRSVPGRYRVADFEWPLIRWAQYNAAIHLVCLFAGGVLRSTPLWTAFLRLNGATIGRDVHVNTLNMYDHNQLEIGDHSVIGSDVKMSGHVGERGEILIAPIRLGQRVTIGTNSIVYPGVTIGDRTAVGAMSLILKDQTLEPDCVYAGVPARRVRGPEKHQVAATAHPQLGATEEDTPPPSTDY